MPLRETAFQGYTFLALLYAGALSALLFDVLSPLSRLNAAFRVMMDLFLCTGAAFLCFLALEATHCDALRLYMPLSFLLGGIIYHLGIRRLLQFVIKLIRPDRKKDNHGE